MIHSKSIICLYQERYARKNSKPQGLETHLRHELLKTDRTANLCTKIMVFRGFDSSIVFILRGGTLMSIGGFLEMFSQRVLVCSFLLKELSPDILSQTILVGISSAGRLGAVSARCTLFLPPLCLSTASERRQHYR